MFKRRKFVNVKLKHVDLFSSIVKLYWLQFYQPCPLLVYTDKLPRRMLLRTPVHVTEICCGHDDSMENSIVWQIYWKYFRVPNYKCYWVMLRVYYKKLHNDTLRFIFHNDSNWYTIYPLSMRIIINLNVPLRIFAYQFPILLYRYDWFANDMQIYAMIQLIGTQIQ